MLGGMRIAPKLLLAALAVVAAVTVSAMQEPQKTRWTVIIQTGLGDENQIGSFTPPEAEFISEDGESFMLDPLALKLGEESCDEAHEWFERNLPSLFEGRESIRITPSEKWSDAYDRAFMLLSPVEVWLRRIGGRLIDIEYVELGSRHWSTEVWEVHL